MRAGGGGGLIHFSLDRWFVSLIGQRCQAHTSLPQLSGMYNYLRGGWGWCVSVCGSSHMVLKLPPHTGPPPVCCFGDPYRVLKVQDPKFRGSQYF